MASAAESRSRLPDEQLVEVLALGKKA